MNKDEKEVDIKQQMRLAFRLGSIEEQKKLQKRLDCLRRTNGRLWEELTKLDKEEPVQGIIVPMELFKKIIIRLKKGQQYTYANKLQ